MPGLIAFNRKWVVASDDLVIPFGIAVVLRAAWLTMVVILFGIHLNSTHNHTVDKSGNICNYKNIHLYFYVHIVVLLMSSINDSVIAYVSSKGTIFDKERRKNIPKLLYIRLTILLFEAGWAIYGCIIIFVDSKYCPNNIDKWLSKAVVVFNFLWVLSSLIVTGLSFDTAGKIWYKLDQKARTGKQYGSVDTLEFNKRIIDANENSWLKTCRLLFCCTKTETSRDNVLLFASKLFAEYFHSYTDLVPSDILAGIILLRQKQKYEERQRVRQELKDTSATYQEVQKHKKHKSVRRHQKTLNSLAFDMDNEDEVKILDDVTYFAKFALACYGWPMYCFLNKIPICRQAGCRLMSHIRCCGSCRQTPDHYPIVTGDNCCFCNLATQKTYLKVNNDNFIYVSYSDEVFQTPFSIIVDNQKKSIVISCRGTLSLKDVLTDMAIDEEQIPDGDVEWTAHTGFLNAAQAIKAIIEEKQLIEQAQRFDVDKGSQNYKIVIVGHSLGAGTATLLAFLLKSKYPQLVCYAYGPSGSAVSYEASCYAKGFIYSVVLGKDIIGRLNMNTLNELQHNILQLLEKTELPKWRILHGCMCQCILCCTRSSTHSYDEYFASEEEILDFEPYNPPNPRKLYMAGNVVHICKTKSIYPRYGRKKASYQACWSTPEDFQNILISNLMLSDHFPDTLIEALTSILPDDIEQLITVVNEDDNGSASICVLSSPDSDERNESESLLPQPATPSILA